MKFPPLRLRSAFQLGGLTIRELLTRTWKKINDNEILTRAAAVAFYAMLALVPFLGLIMTLAVQFMPDMRHVVAGAHQGFGSRTVEEFRSTLKDLVPAEAYQLVEVQIARLQQQPPVGLLSVGLAITVWLASSLFLAVIDAMNRIYGVVETRSIVKLRLVAILMTFIQAVILLGSLVSIVAGPWIMGRLGLSVETATLATILQWPIIYFMVLLSFALAYYVGPDADQSWEWITPGSLFGTAIFLVVSLLFRVYVQRFANYDKTYGPLGGVMVILFWFWLSSVILLTAGQMNKVIEDASPLGKNVGQKVNPATAPDFAAMPPEPASPDKQPES